MAHEESLIEADAIYLDTSVLLAQLFNEPERGRMTNVLMIGCQTRGASIVAVGEVIGRLNKKNVQSKEHPLAVMRAARTLLMSMDDGPDPRGKRHRPIGQIERVEPPEDLAQFIIHGARLGDQNRTIGAFDLWHILAALEWRRARPTVPHRREATDDQRADGERNRRDD